VIGFHVPPPSVETSHCCVAPVTTGVYASAIFVEEHIGVAAGVAVATGDNVFTIEKLTSPSALHPVVGLVTATLYVYDAAGAEADTVGICIAVLSKYVPGVQA
jgi:hypothetical protein